MPNEPEHDLIPKMKKDTSWEKVSHWYDEHLQTRDSYQSKVILPNLLRVLNLQGDERVLDLACGQGLFTREMAEVAKEVVGVDLSPTLISYAKKIPIKNAVFFVGDSAKMVPLKDHSFDTVVCVLALQNIESLAGTIKEVARVIKKSGRFVFVLNHPAFRIPKKSSWEFDDKSGVQYRRVDAYLSSSKERIDMTPGKKSGKTHTVSFHRSLQDYMKALRAQHFAISTLEEWISHKTSDIGPRKRAEDVARKEFPLFLCIEARALL